MIIILRSASFDLGMRFGSSNIPGAGSWYRTGTTAQDLGPPKLSSVAPSRWCAVSTRIWAA